MTCPDEDYEDVECLMTALDRDDPSDRMTIAFYNKHSGEAETPERVWFPQELLSQLRMMLDRSRAFDGVVRMGRAIWQSEE